MEITAPAPQTAVAGRAEAERRVFAKIGWRLMPLLILSYILNYLDRTNVSFAALTMRDAIGLSVNRSITMCKRLVMSTGLVVGAVAAIWQASAIAGAPAVQRSNRVAGASVLGASYAVG